MWSFLRVTTSLIRRPVYLITRRRARNLMACCLSGYFSHAVRIFLSSSLVIGFISVSAILPGFRPMVGSLPIHSETWQKRKNALKFSSFFPRGKILVWPGCSERSNVVRVEIRNEDDALLGREVLKLAEQQAELI